MEDPRQEPAEVPTTTFDAKSRVDGHRIQSQLGRLKARGQAIATGAAPRDYDRHEDRAAARRSKKATRSRDRRERDKAVAADTLAQQARVALGRTSANEHVVRNARAGLAKHVEQMQAEFVGLTEEDALEVILTGAERMVAGR